MPLIAIYCFTMTRLILGDDGKPQLGHRKLIKGEKSFFLKPGEDLEDGIQDMYVLGDDEGLVLRALEVTFFSSARICWLSNRCAVLQRLTP